MSRTFFYPIIFLSIILGFLFPVGKEFKILIPVLLALLLFFGFLKTDMGKKDFYRKELGLYGINLLLFMPLFSYFAYKNLFSFDYAVGLFLLAVTPTGLSLTGLIDLVRDGDRKMVVAIIVVFTLFAMVAIPVLTYIFYRRNIRMDLLSLFLNLILLILVPYIAAFIFKKIFPEKFLESIKKSSYYINFIILFAIIFVAVSAARASIVLNYSMFYLFLAVMGIYIFQALSGFFLAHFFDRIHTATFTITCASKNTQLALIVALLNFGDAATIPCVIGIIGNHLTFSSLLLIFHIRGNKNRISGV